VHVHVQHVYVTYTPHCQKYVLIGQLPPLSL
jgi:hypothetical protein